MILTEAEPFHSPSPGVGLTTPTPQTPVSGNGGTRRGQSGLSHTPLSLLWVLNNG